MADAFQMFQNIFAFKNTGYVFKIAARLDIPEFYVVKQAVNLIRPQLLEYAYLALFLLLLAISAFLISRKNALEIVEHAFRPAEPEPGKKLWLPITLLLVWCIISFSQVSTFIYFNF